MVVIGSSWGGLNALTTIIGGLPREFPMPVVIVQHRSRDSTSALADLLEDAGVLPVCEVDDKAPVVAGHVYIAPADYHLLIEGDHFSLSTEAPQRYSRPSIDVTFESASYACNKGAIGVVLTGANQDGSAGLRTIVRRGGRAIVQDPETAESPTMPRAAIDAVPSALVVPLSGIAGELLRLAAQPAAERTTSGKARPTTPSRPERRP
jgi:two-component system chemotaxis response regulator CheB